MGRNTLVKHNKKPLVLDFVEWPVPFWAGTLDEWHQPPVLEWIHPASKLPIRFQSTFIDPEYKRKINSGRWDSGRHFRGTKLPIVFFFGGMDCPPGIDGLGVHKFAETTPIPCIMVTPWRPRGKWWVLSKGGDYGYIDGDVQDDLVSCLLDWMRCLCHKANQDGSVDGDHPRALGFSAGAYALTEMLHSSSKPFFWSLSLGALHGHGQADGDGLNDEWRRLHSVKKFEAYVQRIRTHVGAPGGIYCFHHREDRVCPWRFAHAIYKALSARQHELGHLCDFEEVTMLDKSSRKTTARQEEMGLTPQMHGYQDTAFLTGDLLAQLLRPATIDGKHHEEPSRTLRLDEPNCKEQWHKSAWSASHGWNTNSWYSNNWQTPDRTRLSRSRSDRRPIKLVARH